MLEIKNLSLDYENISLLKNINLTINSGEITVITGKSGSGKSSLLKVLTGIIPEVLQAKLAGEIIYNEKNIFEDDISKRAKYISTVFQNPKTQFYCINTTDELAFALENRSIPKDEILKTIDEYTKLLNTGKFLERDIFTLSGGEKQLVAITSVACMNNEIYIFDEPSASLDRESVRWLRDTLVKLKNMGKIVIVAEHRLYYLKDIFDKLCVIENGEMFNYDKKDFECNLEDIRKKHELRAFDEIKKEDFAKENFYQIDILNNKNNAKASTILSCLDYKVSYENELIIDFSPDFDKGIYFIIGKNGVGKSTFVKKLCNLIKGKGKSFYEKTKMSKSYDYISLVMQDVNYQLFTESVWQEISITSDDTDLKETVLQELGLLDKKEFHPQILSGGEKQRLLIAMAKVSKKPIVIFDEPTSGLDSLQMKRIAKYIQDMKNEGKLVIVITHDYELIKECGGNVFEFYK